jgi:hypothetical protein
MWGRRRACKPRLFSVVTIFVVVHPTKRADLSRHGYRAAQFEDALARFLTTQAEHPNTQAWGRRKDVKVFGLIALDAALGATEVKRLYEVLEKRLAEVKARPSPLQTSWRSVFVSVRRNRMAIASSATTANVFSMVSFLPREILGRAS